MTFASDGRSGGNVATGKNGVSVPCAPLQSFLDLIDVRHVSFFSLDVEGYELNVLKSIDWTKASVATMVVEELLWHKQKNEEVRQLLREDAGFDFLGATCWKEVACDSFWINKKFVDVAAAKQHLLTNPFPEGKYEIGQCQPTRA